MPGGGGNLGTIGKPRFHPRNRIERREKHPLSAKDIAKNHFFADIDLHRVSAGTPLDVIGENGKIIRSISAPKDRGKVFKLDLSDLPAGVYFIHRFVKTLFGIKIPRVQRIVKDFSPQYPRWVCGNCAPTNSATCSSESPDISIKSHSIIGYITFAITICCNIMLEIISYIIPANSMGLKNLLATVITLIGLSTVTYGASVIVKIRPSQLGNYMVTDTLKGWLSTGRDTMYCPIRGPPEYDPPASSAYNQLNMDPLPCDDDTIAFFEGVGASGASINIRNPNYVCGATCQFPDVAPTDAGGEHNIMIDMLIPRDSTGIDPYLGNFFFL